MKHLPHLLRLLAVGLIAFVMTKYFAAGCKRELQSLEQPTTNTP